jgi:hypothetical protein
MSKTMEERRLIQQRVRERLAQPGVLEQIEKEFEERSKTSDKFIAALKESERVGPKDWQFTCTRNFD